MSAWNPPAKAFVASIARVAAVIGGEDEYDLEWDDCPIPDIGMANLGVEWFNAGALTVAIPDELFSRWADTDIANYEIPDGTESMLVLLPKEFGFVLYTREELRIRIYAPDIANGASYLVPCDQSFLDMVLQNPDEPVPILTVGQRVATEVRAISPIVHALIRVALLTQLAIETGDLQRTGIERSGKQINQDNRRANRNRRKSRKPQLPKADEACPEVQLFTFGKDLAAEPRRDPELDEAILHAIRTGEHKYKNRFKVRGHFQKQVFGKAKDDPSGNNKPLWGRKHTYHESYWSGAKKGPLLVRAEIVDTTSPQSPIAETVVDDRA